VFYAADEEKESELGGGWQPSYSKICKINALVAG
jgi:hypothetical protein